MTLYRDPIHDGAADPTVIWNHFEREWWMVYTSRRREDPANGVGWVHGTSIGVASSSDHGGEWLYRGDLDIPPAPGDFGRNTFWAPEIVFLRGRYHMYVSFIRGVPTSWAGHPRTIRHYVSDDLAQWEFCETLTLSSDRVIDACVREVPGGGYRLWYKHEADGNTIWAADSEDLHTWTVRGRVLAAGFALEGPYVFELGGRYWMTADGKAQYLCYSDDLETWTPAGVVLDTASGLASGRDDDLGPGLHAQVVVAGEVGWLFYFTHPERHRPDLTNADHRRSTIQVAQLRSAGDHLTCVRDGSVVLDLSAAEPA
jgi:Glycosyl hydrolases family 43